jgi:protein SCO1
MKTKLTFACLTLLAAVGLHAAEPAKGACCPACGAEEKPAATLTARSLYQLGATWTTDRGESLQLSSLRGKPVVIAMFFSQCEYACPMIVSDMQRIRESLPAAIRDQAKFVLVSFDVARDTPAVLKTYRERTALDGSWTLLHGDSAAVQELAMLLGVKYKQDPRGQFSHSNLITVLNPEGEIAFQRPGLGGDISEAAKAVTVSMR